MTIAALSSPSIFTSACAAPSTGTSQTAAFDPDTDASDDPFTANSLTGSSTGSLASQTLQALMDLTQGSGDQTSGAQSSSTQAQGAHRHHHHHGGQQAQQGGSSTAATDTASSSAMDTTGAPAAAPA